MKVLIAMDSFKGSISSIEGSVAIAEGIRTVDRHADLKVLPLADGGEGTVEALVEATGGELFSVSVTGPLQEKVDALYGILGDQKTAVIEIASACGLPLIPAEKRNPLVTTTYGVGELILDAIEKGCHDFVIGLGGSATNDAGIGMLQALGFRFMDSANKQVGLGGQVLKDIRKIDSENVHPALKKLKFKIACDVNNPLYGERGAAHVYGPQKGASPKMVKELDDGLRNFAKVVSDEFGRNIHHIEGTGAAGGLGVAFKGFLNADLKSGIELILESIGMEEEIQGMDIVITGEGKLDGQTSMGKTAMGVARLAEKYGVPVIALAGSVSEEGSTLNEIGITSYFSILNTPISLEEAVNPELTVNNLRSITVQLFQLIKVFLKK